ncbi:MAG TPA: iron ABC transporter permease [Spirochaetia bacterium]|nr:iron ABC transporter permease [Spirochaetia bacterium]
MIIRFPSGEPEPTEKHSLDPLTTEGGQGPSGRALRTMSPSRRTGAGLLALSGVLLVTFLADLYLGSVHITLGELFRFLVGLTDPHSTAGKILLIFRLPKAIAALLAGAALAIAGLQMQTIFRNPLAGPFVLGINSGASLGVSIIVLAVGASTGSVFLQSFGAGGQLTLVLAATIGSAGVLLLVLAFSSRVRGVMTLLILGLLFGYAVSAIVSILIQFSSADRIQTYIAWTFGSFGGVTWRELPIFAPVLSAGVLASLFAAKQLNALLLGEHYAASMGLKVRRARVSIILLTALLAGTVTAFCGPIAFIGVAIPHLMRSLFSTSNHRILLPAVALMGSVAALAADIISHVPGSDLILPLNSVTALIGAPVVVWVILKRNNLQETFGS